MSSANVGSGLPAAQKLCFGRRELATNTMALRPALLFLERPSEEIRAIGMVQFEE
jgi:hypothetical protein